MLEIKSNISLSSILKPKFKQYITKFGVKPNTIIMSSDYKYSKTYELNITRLLEKGYKVIFSYEIPKKTIYVAYIENIKLKDEIDDQIPF